jgi:Putative addiction module component
MRYNSQCMSVETTIDIKQMSIDEKIGLMELLWRDISKNPEDVPVPEWHLKILEERQRAVANGETHYIDFEDAVAEIRRHAEAIRRIK